MQDPVRDPQATHGSDGARFAALVRGVDAAAIDRLLARSPAPALRTHLQALAQDLAATDPRSAAKAAGFWGRLIGRDLVAGARARMRATGLDARRVEADRLAAALRDFVAEVDRAAADLAARLAALDALSEPASRARSVTVEIAADSEDVRPDHAAAVAATWRLALAHLDLVRRHAVDLLARHVQLRDVLIPLARQQARATALRDAAPDAALDRSLRAILDLPPAPAARGVSDSVPPGTAP